MSQASIDSIADTMAVTLTADEIQNLADRLLSRGCSTISTYSQREKADLILASRALRELLRLYRRGTGETLHSFVLFGGHP